MPFQNDQQAAALARGTVELRRLGNQAIRVGVSNELNKIGPALAKELEPFYRSLLESVRVNAIPKSLLKETNLYIARLAYIEMASGYHSRLPRKSEAYRSESRLTGVLGSAMANENAMVKNTTDRVISFLDAGFLQTEAVHWWRVNYGARGPNLDKSTHVAEAFPIALGPASVGMLRDDTPPAPNSWIPKRWYWRGNEFRPGGDTHGPRGYANATEKARSANETDNKVIPGRGSRAARFTDLGVASVAREWGPAYARMFNDYMRTQKGQARLASKGVIIRGPIAAPIVGR